MVICFLEGDMSRGGGTEKMTAWLANALSNEHCVHILSLRLEAEASFFPLVNEVSHQVLPVCSGKTGIRKQIRWIRHYIRTNNIQRVVNVDTGMGVYGILAAIGTEAKVITWEHGNFYNNWGSRLFPALRRFAAVHSDALVVLTRRDQENYQKHIRRCAPVYVIPNPAAKRPCAYDAGSKIILSVGHLTKNKGFHRAVAVASAVLPRHPEFKWVICGEGPERPRLESLIRESGLEKQMLLPGLVRDMDAMYCKAAVLVMTSEMEGLPMVLLEGKAHALPLVAFDIMTGPGEIIHDGVNGYLIPPFALDTMANRLEDLMTDAALRTRLSENAAVGLEKFSEEAILSTWKKVLGE